MVNIIKEELLKRKLELIRKSSKVIPTIINENIRKIDKTTQLTLDLIELSLRIKNF